MAADLRYQPKVKDLSEAMYFPLDKKEEYETLSKILSNYIRNGERAQQL